MFSPFSPPHGFGNPFSVGMSTRLTLIHDHFNADDGTPLNGRSPAPTNRPGTTWTYISNASNALIRNNRASCESIFQAPTAWQVNPAKDDLEIEAEFQLGAVNTYGTGVIFRYSDWNNYWHALLDDVNDLFILRERSGGVNTTIDSVPVALTTGVPYRIRVRVVRDVARVWLNGDHQLTAEGVYVARPRCGFYLAAYGAGNEWCDWFRVRVGR